MSKLHRPRLLAAASTVLALSVSAVALPSTAHADTLVSSTFKVNFQATTTSTPAGWTGDAGQAYSDTRGYGWTTTGGTPLDLTANGRQRNVSSDPLLDTFMQMQAKAGSGTTTQGSWKAAIANGTYTVTVGVGDPSYFDSRHVVNVEGTRVVDHTATSAARSKVSTADVTVTDGFLDVDATGGTNTKIDYLQIAPQGSTSPAAIAVSSPEDALALGSRMVFSTVQNEFRAGHNLTVRNTGGSPLAVTGLTFGGASAGDFRLCTGQATSFSVPAGGSAAVCVRYTPQKNAATTNSTVVSQATLTVNSSAGPWVVTLGGLSAIKYENDKEPSLQLIFDALGYTTNAAVSFKPFWGSISGTSAPVGDEVLAPYFTRLDSSAPVKLVPLAQYSGKSSNKSASIGWYAKGSSTNNYLYAYPGGADGSNSGYGQNQLLVPATTTASNGVNTVNFTPSGAFGIVDALSYSNRSDDARNGSRWHNMRAYPAKDAAGNVIRGAYLIGNDIGGVANNSAKNWDYQDFAFLLLNATPDAGSSQPTAGEYSKTLAGFTGAAGGVDGSGFTTAQGTVDAAKINYGGGSLLLTSSNDTNTSHTNALQLGVNAGTKFRVQSRLLGPFTAINAGAEQQGIYFGPNATNYIKAELEWSTADNARKLTVWKQTSSAGGAVAASVLLPGGDSQRVDLRIEVDPAPRDAAHYNGAPQVVVSYSLYGTSTWTRINTGDVSIPATWVTANTPAGIIASHQQGGSPFVANFANFSVTRVNG
ncbi:hypothetical protein [Nakamurella deserti]|uniref:hypothetical protein n=1 Tax=Nakamurella deserti TaxID=2164074 RepID=UPI000DBE303E|nr:hypothetical protein [Nakamurella deserti]